jgi:RNA polymerase sigma-70 factor (ECF subfamily)
MCETAENEGQAGPGAEELEAYRPYLLAVANALIAPLAVPGETASDMVQKALIAANRNAAEGRLRVGDEEALKGYLRRVLRNVIIDARRRDQAQVRGGRLGRTGEVLDLADDTTSPSGRAARGEEMERLAAALRALPEAESRLIVWKHFDGLTFEEIAERIGLTASGSKKAYRRALESLRWAYKEAAARDRVVS